MATMIKIAREKELTPEDIQSKLFYLSDVAHKFHLDTKSFEEHQALKYLYEALIDYRDDLSEKLMGYMDGKRIGELKMKSIPSYSKEEVMSLAKEVRDFGYELYEWAGDKKYCDIENKAQELSGVGAKTIYLLTLT